MSRFTDKLKILAEWWGEQPRMRKLEIIIMVLVLILLATWLL